MSEGVHETYDAKSTEIKLMHAGLTRAFGVMKSR